MLLLYKMKKESLKFYRIEKTPKADFLTELDIECSGNNQSPADYKLFFVNIFDNTI